MDREFGLRASTADNHRRPFADEFGHFAGQLSIARSGERHTTGFSVRRVRPIGPTSPGWHAKCPATSVGFAIRLIGGRPTPRRKFRNTKGLPSKLSKKAPTQEYRPWPPMLRSPQTHKDSSTYVCRPAPEIANGSSGGIGQRRKLAQRPNRATPSTLVSLT